MSRPKPPVVTVVEVTDPTAAREGIEILGQDVVQLDQDLFRVRRVIARLDSTWLVRPEAKASAS